MFFKIFLWYFGPYTPRVKDVSRWDPLHVDPRVKFSMHTEFYAYTSIHFSGKTAILDILNLRYGVVI